MARHSPLLMDSAAPRAPPATIADTPTTRHRTATPGDAPSGPGHPTDEQPRTRPTGETQNTKHRDVGQRRYAGAHPLQRRGSPTATRQGITPPTLIPLRDTARRQDG